MASNTKTASDYIAVASPFDIPPKASVVAPRLPEGKKTDKKKKKETKRRCLCMCFSNMQFEEEDGEKTMAFMKSEESKLAMVMCFSNFHVGPNDTKVPKMSAK
ncbi:hypothetical protein V6N13_129122 [Hibiscus sabdariffa]